MYEVVVVGGGPAGLSAALTLGRARRSTLLLDQGTGRNAPAAAMHNFFLHDGDSPEHLRETGRRQLSAYPTVEIRDATVESATAADSGFEVVLGAGETVRCHRLLLATGVRDELPAIPGIEALWGRSVFHCPYCHGYENTGQPVAVLGGTPDRALLALQLTRFTDDLVLCTDGPAELPPPLRSALADRGVPIRTEPVEGLETQTGALTGLRFSGGAPLARSAAFVKPLLRQRSDLAGRLGCTGFDDGTIEIDEFARTSTPGVFAAGDMCRRAGLPIPLGAIALAVAAGMFAGAAVDQDLVFSDFHIPNPFAPSAA
ncbi:NAD(P)/FAD-dependent oxidoreductase [Amycolatopsis sp. YIM 10]|uniref:NAD(P)/FAD-dependent oxidoreductase n=1 Tax=Amycolatopsis sp. YIM 10 TaxID=2653857 RepID=UPI001290701B|nr:NAD(P)/FAD-dependent oxidoreductase [Amycolatopsis sp. YIM 10]QFU90571.1 Alkyl hydroperoxide reductase subunit F [Amycolatopsis sp. YIM 10]